MTTNPFEDLQNTTGGRAGHATFGELQTDKAYDDETLKPNPGAPLPAPEGSVQEYLDQRKNIEIPDYEGIQLQKFRDIKKTSEAMDDTLEREFIDPINQKKQEIVTIMATAFSGIPASSPPSNKQLIVSDGSAPDTEVVYQAGISTFVYAIIPGTPDVDVIGVRGQIFPDILAAYHYPNLSDGNHGDTDLPLADPEFIKASRTVTRSAEYSTNTLGIGKTVTHSGDNDYAGASGIVTSQTPLGNFYFFGGTEDSNGIGDNINNLTSGAQSSVSTLITEIKTLRTNLRVRIGPPHIGNSAGINTLRESKHRDELEVWYDEAGDRTQNIADFQGGMDALDENATSIALYDS
tara:strand:- start:366 stop:1412 length:1047 start_codon:yes stop_codon:yes gene_type:complete